VTNQTNVAGTGEMSPTAESAPTNVAPPRNGYFPGLDGLRGIAFLLVFAVHLTPPGLDRFRRLTGGYLGLDLFFVLSGFLITTILVGEFTRGGAINLRKFYLRRAIRLFPAILLFAAAVFILTWTEGVFKADAADIRRNALGAISYFYNWIAIYSTNRGHDVFFVGPLWSLSVEEQFYFIFPVSLLLGLRRGRGPSLTFPMTTDDLRARLTRVVTFLIGGLIVSNVLITSIGVIFERHDSYERAMWGTDTRASGFILGALAAVIRLAYPVLYRRVVRHLQWLAPIAFVGFVGSCLFFPERPQVLPFAGGLFVIDVAVVVMVLAAVERTWGWLSFVFEFPLLRWVGKVSYGAYVIHFLLVWRFFIKDPNFFRVPFPPILAMTLAIAAASFYGIEQPLARRLRRRWNL
jgi:peptidoglycan/LPS O-acetylase OafA/YrhL